MIPGKFDGLVGARGREVKVSPRSYNN